MPDDACSQYRMLEVPTLVVFGQESYRNKFDLSESGVLSRNSPPPRRSRPPASRLPHCLREAYAQAFVEGAEHIVVVTVTSKLSGTFRSAQMATQELGGERFTMWDSQQHQPGQRVAGGDGGAYD